MAHIGAPFLLNSFHTKDSVGDHELLNQLAIIGIISPIVSANASGVQRVAPVALPIVILSTVGAIGCAGTGDGTAHKRVSHKRVLCQLGYGLAPCAGQKGWVCAIAAGSLPSRFRAPRSTTVCADPDELPGPEPGGRQSSGGAPSNAALPPR